MRFERKTFRQETLVMDGNDYLSCTFHDCTLFYTASGAESLTKDCRFLGHTNFLYGGHAEATIRTLATLYRDGAPDVRRNIEGLFSAIRAREDPRGWLRLISWDQLRGRPASHSAQMLAAIYHGMKPAGPSHIESLFDQIRGDALITRPSD